MILIILLLKLHSCCLFFNQLSWCVRPSLCSLMLHQRKTRRTKYMVEEMIENKAFSEELFRHTQGQLFSLMFLCLLQYYEYHHAWFIGLGLTFWTIATIGCGFSVNIWSITVCRMLVGVGEASFISLTAPFIDDNAPVSQKTVWLGIFYTCIPSGVALGYVYGGLVDFFIWMEK